jgi:hypothetical protein
MGAFFGKLHWKLPSPAHRESAGEGARPHVSNPVSEGYANNTHQVSPSLAQVKSLAGIITLSWYALQSCEGARPHVSNPASEGYANNTHQVSPSLAQVKSLAGIITLSWYALQSCGQTYTCRREYISQETLFPEAQVATLDGVSRERSGTWNAAKYVASFKKLSPLLH